MLSKSATSLAIFAITAILITSFTLVPHFPPLFTWHTGYQAPLLSCDLPTKAYVAGSFIVYLHPNCSMAQHTTYIQAALDRDLLPSVVRVYEEGFASSKQVIYYGRDIDKKLLKAIRSDEGVEQIYCDITGSLDSV